MGGSESKATVLECMIKNLKKGFGGDYGVKVTDAPQRATTASSSGRMGHYHQPPVA